MFTVMRGHLNILDYADRATLDTAISATTVKAGDRIFWRFTKYLYGVCNAAGNGVTLATA